MYQIIWVRFWENLLFVFTDYANLKDTLRYEKICFLNLKAFYYGFDYILFGNLYRFARNSVHFFIRYP